MQLRELNLQLGDSYEKQYGSQIKDDFIEIDEVLPHNWKVEVIDESTRQESNNGESAQLGAFNEYTDLEERKNRYKISN